MKKVLKFLGCLCTLMLAVIMLPSCDKLPGANTQNPAEPTAEEYIEDVVNPTFMTPEEVISYQAKLIEQCHVDEVFTSLKGNTLRNIATVCLKQDGSAKKQDIVYEYLANQSVYDNLPSSGQPAQESPAPTPDTTDAPPVEITVDKPNPGGEVPPPSTITRVESDTMNGVPLKVTIREERRYERQ